MRLLQFTILIFSLFIFFNINAQKNKINGTYIWDMTEYLTILEDSFKLHLYPTYPVFYGLDLGDTILTEGKIEYDSDNFIKLTSKDYEWEARKNMIIEESVDSSLVDKVKFTFIFPFEGKYKIILSLKNNYTEKIYEFQDRNEFILPIQKDDLLEFSFLILNQTPPTYQYRTYNKAIAFNSSKKKRKEKDSNSFKIFIPDLTNSYFNRFWIKGEYIKVNTEKDVLFWHNEKYLKSTNMNYHSPL